MSTEMTDAGQTTALDFARALASLYQAQLGERLIGAYLIGSLAHGGFSHRYSDIDMAVVTEDGLDTAAYSEPKFWPTTPQWSRIWKVDAPAGRSDIV